MSEQTYTLVLDRFEEDDAVLLVEQDGDLVDEIVLPKTMLPADGQHQDAIFSVRHMSETVTELQYDPEQTQERKESAQDRFNRLSQRLPSEDVDEHSDHP
ncbi:DUF3006 domain-containing protein [Haloprofundus salilacus]|uniref:DUF3006 domain-containing protein n=1 Tax=Haloprofundus salilacus TaxID=2876190 RepID=UPI001CCE7C72|nr:DUF3006 domain-containing protein [Haloprofundus salilacus]